MKFDQDRRRISAAERTRRRERVAALVDRQEQRAAQGLERCWARRAAAAAETSPNAGAEAA